MRERARASADGDGGNGGDDGRSCVKRSPLRVPVPRLPAQDRDCASAGRRAPSGRERLEGGVLCCARARAQSERERLSSTARRARSLLLLVLLLRPALSLHTTQTKPHKDLGLAVIIAASTQPFPASPTLSHPRSKTSKWSRDRKRGAVVLFFEQSSPLLSLAHAPPPPRPSRPAPPTGSQPCARSSASTSVSLPRGRPHGQRAQGGGTQGRSPCF